MKAVRTHIALALMASAALAACSRGDSNNANDTTAAMAGGALDSSNAGAASGAPVVTDETIIRTVSAIDLGEVQAGQLAQTKGTHADVKSFARMMVTEHTAMSKQDSQMASRLNITLNDTASGSTGRTAGGTAGAGGTGGTTGTTGAATTGAAGGSDMHAQVTQMNQQTMEQLRSAKKGAEFDRAYIDSQVQGHQAALQHLQQFQNSTQNQDLRTAVQNAIPKVQQHLERAQQIQQRLGQANNPS